MPICPWTVSLTYLNLCEGIMSKTRASINQAFSQMAVQALSQMGVQAFSQMAGQAFSQMGVQAFSQMAFQAFCGCPLFEMKLFYFYLVVL